MQLNAYLVYKFVVLLIEKYLVSLFNELSNSKCIKKCIIITKDKDLISPKADLMSIIVYITGGGGYSTSSYKLNLIN